MLKWICLFFRGSVFKILGLLYISELAMNSFAVVCSLENMVHHWILENISLILFIHMHNFREYSFKLAELIFVFHFHSNCILEPENVNHFVVINPKWNKNTYAKGLLSHTARF